MSDDPVGKFGELLITKLRDRAIEAFDLACEGHGKAPGLQKLQADLAQLTPEQKDVARRAVLHALDNGIHDFLFALVEAQDHDEGIMLLVDGQNIVELSDGLQGEPWGERGWIERFGQYGERE